MLKYGLPLSIGAILSGFLTQFYSTIMYLFVTNNSLIGNYSVSLNFVVLITFFATPVTTMLFPAFSKLDAKKERELLQNVFQYSVKYATLVVVPVTAMIMALAQPAINTIFEGKYEQAPFYLALSAVTYLLTAFGSLSVGNLINSQGYTKYNLKLTLLTVAIGFPLSYVLISHIWNSRFNSYKSYRRTSKSVFKFALYKKEFWCFYRLESFCKNHCFHQVLQQS